MFVKDSFNVVLGCKVIAAGYGMTRSKDLFSTVRV